LLSLKRNLMQILCSLKSAISVAEKIAGPLKHDVTETHVTQERVLSACPAVGTLIHKGYCSAHLAAEGRTTTGSRAIFKFPNFWVASRRRNYTALYPRNLSSSYRSP
jgi:hypothetical protein